MFKKIYIQKSVFYKSRGSGQVIVLTSTRGIGARCTSRNCRIRGII